VKFFDISQDSFLSSMPEYPMSVLKMALWTLSYDCDLIILKYDLFIPIFSKSCSKLRTIRKEQNFKK
jgi:hypothetical protein